MTDRLHLKTVNNRYFFKSIGCARFQADKKGVFLQLGVPSGDKNNNGESKVFLMTGIQDHDKPFFLYFVSYGWIKFDVYIQ